MNAEISAVYDLTGSFRGFTILRGNKLGSTNIWPEAELDDLRQQIARLNADATIRRHWPNTRDPEVQALLNNPEFMPYATTIESVVDDENSYYVWDKVDDEGNPAPGASIDRNSSVIVYKDKVIPKNPSEVKMRFKRAHEVVARLRAGLDEGEALHSDGHGNYISADDPTEYRG